MLHFRGCLTDVVIFTSLSNVLAVCFWMSDLQIEADGFTRCLYFQMRWDFSFYGCILLQIVKKISRRSRFSQKLSSPPTHTSIYLHALVLYCYKLKETGLSRNKALCHNVQFTTRPQTPLHKNSTVPLWHDIQVANPNAPSSTEGKSCQS